MYTRPLIDPREPMAGCTAPSALPYKQMEVEAQACQEGWQFGFGFKMNRAKQGLKMAKGARGW